MSWLLDTNVVSELRKGTRANPGVAAWFAPVADAELFISALVVGEIRRGVELIRRRDPISAQALDQWLARLIESYGDRVLPVDGACAECWGALNVSDPLPTVDGLIAATAITRGLTVVTRNVAGIGRTAANILKPFID